MKLVGDIVVVDQKMVDFARFLAIAYSNKISKPILLDYLLSAVACEFEKIRIYIVYFAYFI